MAEVPAGSGPALPARGPAVGGRSPVPGPLLLEGLHHPGGAYSNTSTR